jgi:hypothetical protein
MTAAPRRSTGSSNYTAASLGLSQHDQLQAPNDVHAQEQDALWLGDRHVLVVGLDLLQPKSDQPERNDATVIRAAAGANLVETADWRSCVIDAKAGGAAIAPGCCPFTPLGHDRASVFGRTPSRASQAFISSAESRYRVCPQPTVGRIPDRQCHSGCRHTNVRWRLIRGANDGTWFLSSRLMLCDRTDRFGLFGGLGGGWLWELGWRGEPRSAEVVQLP